MKVECLKEKLRTAATNAERVTGKNLALPILGSILIEAKEKTLLIRATNLEVGVEFEIPSKILEKGKVAVSGSLLNSFLGLVGDGDVIKIETVNENMVLTTRSSSSMIKCLPSDDFPTIPKLGDSNVLELDAVKLVNGLRSVAYAASLSDMKPEISSVYLYGEEDEIVFAATDSFRLAEKRIKLKSREQKGDQISIIIPIKNALEIIRVLEGLNDSVSIYYTKNQVSFSSGTGGIYITSRLVNGIFPNYGQIISKDKKSEVVVSKKELLNALKLATVFTDKFNQVTFRIIPGEALFEVSSRNSDTGENTTKVEATVEGEDITVNFNNKYILDCFSSIEENTLGIAFNGAQRPMVIRGVGDTSFFYLVMPLNR
ncbi:MAG: DNA polymerase III subunit beta [Candidatus Vogelbacteria bacterium]|nr:DNA polymerase III subunit beta [Candidatus Vogelbacteria bacterium]